MISMAHPALKIEPIFSRFGAKKVGGASLSKIIALEYQYLNNDSSTNYNIYGTIQHKFSTK